MLRPRPYLSRELVILALCPLTPSITSPDYRSTLSIEHTSRVRSPTYSYIIFVFAGLNLRGPAWEHIRLDWSRTLDLKVLLE